MDQLYELLTMKICIALLLLVVTTNINVHVYGQCTTTILDEPFNTAAIVGADPSVIYGNGGSNHNGSYVMSGSYFGWFNIVNGVGPVDVYDRQVTGLSVGCTVNASIWIRESYGGCNVDISLIDDNGTVIASNTNLTLNGVYQQITLSAPITTTGLRYLIHFNGVGGNGLDIVTEDLLITQTCDITADIVAQLDQCLTGNSFSFDGSGSTADLPITSYSWDYGDASPLGTGANPTYSYPNAGNYTVTLTVSDGSCTDATTINLTVHPDALADAPADVAICNGYVLPALTNGNYFSSPGGIGPIAVGTNITTDQTIYVYAESGTTPNCTDENSFMVTINPAVTGTDAQMACGSYTWIDGQTYTASNNTATHTIVGGSSAGCDSVVTLNLTISNIVTSTDIQSACGSFTWIDGNTYTTSNNTATHTLVGGSVNGCDSIVTLNLTINNTVNSTDVQTACGSYTWIDGNTYTVSNNTATHTIVGAASNGCDSIVTLDLTVNNPTNGTDVQTACGSYTWIDGNTYTTSNSTATHIIVGGSTNGCDSTVSLDLTINNAVNSTDVQSACGSFTWIDGQTYTASNNTATHTIVGGSAAGCDSIISLDLTINGVSTSTDVQVACDSYLWIDGNTYTSSNNTATHTIVGGSPNGCDSIITLDLTINQSSTIIVDTTVCSGTNYTFADGSNHANILLDQTHISTLTGASGCDSIVTENVTVIPPTSIDLGFDFSVCMGETVTIDATTSTGIPIWSTSDSVMSITVTISTDTFFVASLNDNCGSSTDTIFISVFPPFSVDAGPDLTIPLGASVQLNATGANSYLWAPAQFVDCPDCQSPMGITTGDITYFVTGFDENGCTATDTVNVFIDGEISIYIPNVFSPNGDGQNDFFTVYGATWTTYKLEIYNRWGGLVFESENPNIPWSGYL
jgi:hypothetical protein